MRISGYVDVEFGFEQNYLDVGRIRKNQTDTNTTILLMKDKSKMGLLEITSDSPTITAEIIPAPAGTSDSIGIKIVVGADTPPGRIEANITAALTDSSYQPSILHVRGTIIGNLDVNPEIVRFSVARSLPLEKQETKEIRVVNMHDGSALRLLGVEDPNDRLTFDIDSSAAGRQYVIRARPNEKAMQLTRNTAGEVIIRTNDTDQPEIRIRYSMIFPK